MKGESVELMFLKEMELCDSRAESWEYILYADGCIVFLFLQTYIGSVVISVNPYRSLPIYSPEKVEEYRNRNFYELSPHM